MGNGQAATDTLAERSKAVAQGAIPKGRGFEPHRCHFIYTLPCETRRDRAGSSKKQGQSLARGAAPTEIAQMHKIKTPRGTAAGNFRQVLLQLRCSLWRGLSARTLDV